ncbi:GtrA family protein [Arthrobacter sp. 35W]|uniref:GtrA family protein n=1 Tax=Arthrobacter sp. 35W TaxID=1132441 RepID=UPI000686A51D|nr:GtrA family protein [Arthrobacter sp. 35W]
MATTAEQNETAPASGAVSLGTPAPALGRTGAAAGDPGRFATLRHQIKSFLLVAVICTGTSVAIFAALRPATGVQWANGISLVLCSVLNTELNRRMSFGITSPKRWVKDHRRGLWVMLLALGLSSGSLWLLHDLAPDSSMLTELVVITAANVVAAVTRFLLLRYWIFRRVRRARAL